MASKTGNEFEDAPFGVFRLSYSLITWISTFGLIVITVWTIWTMFLNTPAGTLRTQRLAAANPTNEAAAAEYQSRMDPCAPIKPDMTVCAACHVIDGSGAAVCPNLTDIHNTALERIADPAYAGSAETAGDYIRESIVKPDVYIVDPQGGEAYPESSVMAAGLDAAIDLEAVVAYLSYDPEAVCEEVASR